MHVLTKIFIVLVSLLAVLLVPLVAVYAHNEDSFKKKYEVATAQAAAANQNVSAMQVAHAAELARRDLELSELAEANRQLESNSRAAETEVSSLKTDLARAEGMQAGFRADLSTISSAVATGQDMMESLLAEVRTMRTEALAAERRSVELDEALRDVTGQLDVAVAARRALQEELQQLRDEHAHALEQVAGFVERFGRLDLDLTPRAPMVDLDATVVRVSRGSDQTLAEIDAGSRDGVKEGWVMTIGRSGNYLGNLRIIAVDINNATGVVELEDPDSRGQVATGDRVYARRGTS